MEKQFIKILTNKKDKTMITVAFKYLDKEEETKIFENIIEAFQFQGDLLKKKKKNLEYAIIKNNI